MPSGGTFTPRSLGGCWNSSPCDPGTDIPVVLRVAGQGPLRALRGHRHGSMVSWFLLVPTAEPPSGACWHNGVGAEALGGPGWRHTSLAPWHRLTVRVHPTPSLCSGSWKQVTVLLSLEKKGHTGPGHGATLQPMEGVTLGTCLAVLPT